MFPSRNNADRRRFLFGLGAVSLGTCVGGTRVFAAGEGDAVAREMNTCELTRRYIATSRVEIHRSGTRRVRELEIAVMRRDESESSLRRYLFLAPRDIRGASLLIREQSDADNDTWLYLPSVGRTRRISSSRQSTSFAGTDFSYADLMAMRLEKYTHAIVGRAGGSIVLESVVKDRSFAHNIGYSKVVTTMSDMTFLPSKVEYFDTKGRHSKTQTMSDPVATPDGRHVLRSRVMTVLESRHETRIRMSGLAFGAKLRDVDFDPGRLSSAL